MDPPASEPPLTTLEENPAKDYWAFKRKRRRENQKQSKIDPKSAKLEEDASPSDAKSTEPHAEKRNWKNMEMSEILFYTPTIVVDLSFEDKMSHKRLRSLASQLKYSYSSLKQHERPCKLQFTSLKPGSLVYQALEKHDGFDSWKVFKEPLAVEEAYPIEKIVYLSPDSDNLIETLDDEKVYVIGGIVDDNQLKGLSLSKAKKFGIAHGKLPIREYLPSFNNQSLNINTIVEILLAMAQGKGMKDALESAVPQRYVTAKQVWKPGKSAKPTGEDKAVEGDNVTAKEQEE